MTDLLFDAEPEDFDQLLVEASRLYRRAESALTERIGPGRSVVIDPKTWTASGLPQPVLDVAGVGLVSRSGRLLAGAAPLSIHRAPMAITASQQVITQYAPHSWPGIWRCSSE